MKPSRQTYRKQYNAYLAAGHTARGIVQPDAFRRVSPAARPVGQRLLQACCVALLAGLLVLMGASAVQAQDTGGAQASTSAWASAELEHRLARQPLAEVYAWLAEQPSPATPEERLEVQRWLGQMALALGRHAEAAVHFERVIVRQPLDFGTRLELTRAYWLGGNHDAARASLNALEHHLRQQGIDPQAKGQPGLPRAAAEQLASLQQRLSAPRWERATSWFHLVEGSLAIAQGYDSNANLGARDARIPLELWGEIPVVTELASESLAQGSHFTELEVDLERPLTDGSSTADDWQLLAGGRLRHYHQLDALHRRDVYMGLRWRPPLGRQQWLLALQRVQASGFPAQLSLSADYRRLLKKGWLANTQLLVQEEPGLSTSQTLGLGLWHPWQGGLLWVRGSWQLRPERAAGDTWRAELGAETPGWQLGPLALSANASLERRGDTGAYSPPFFGSRRRQETSLELGARARLPLTRELDLMLQVEWQHTESDIALFENRRWQMEGRLAWRW